MADLMVGDDFLLVVGHDSVLLLIPGDDHLDALLQIRLRGETATVPDGPQSRLVDDVGQLCAGSTGGHAGHLVEIHILGDLDLLGMDL